MLALLAQYTITLTMDLRQFRLYLKDVCSEAGGAKPWAEKHRISHSYVSSVIRGDKMPGDKILKAVRVKVVYVKKRPKVMMKFEDITN